MAYSSTDPGDPQRTNAATAAESPGSFAHFMQGFAAYPNFTWIKINHGFWEALAKVEAKTGWPQTEDERKAADKFVKREQFFVGGFVEELIKLLDATRDVSDPAFNLWYGLSAWPGDEGIYGTPADPRQSTPFMRRYFERANARDGGLTLKVAAQTGEIAEWLLRLKDHHVIFVGPQYLDNFGSFARLDDFRFLSIHQRKARTLRAETEAALRAMLEEVGGKAVVLMQAGTLAPYWILRLRKMFPNTRWIDGGLALSICAPADLLRRPWGKVYRHELIGFYNRWLGSVQIPEKDMTPIVAHALAKTRGEHPGRPKVDFVENKRPDSNRILEFLAESEAANQWANGGPVFRALRESYREFVKLPASRDVLPCTNAGVALELLARLHEHKAQRSLRWVASSFSFCNLGRGYFADMRLCDCDEHGMLDLDELARLPDDSYDGIIVTNIFGLWKEFTPYIEFAARRHKVLIIDNAAGLGEHIPNHDYQVFSLHQTKPFGAGEGGLAIMPADESELAAELLNYKTLQTEPSLWLNNGKISDISCAYLLDRLERYPEWGVLYQYQANRVIQIAESAGLTRLFPYAHHSIATCLPFLAPHPVELPQLDNRSLTLGKFYKPLAPTRRAQSVYARIVNVPSHPDVAGLPREELEPILQRLATTSGK
jgi:dTDP-4-amino-4,6-dideoxygalactose transaminase